MRFHGAARLYDEAQAPDTPAGGLSAEWAEKLGLRAGIPVAIGAFDAHYGAVGAGVRPGTLVKIIGTSTCDIAVAPEEGAPTDVPGICGIVPASVKPGSYGIEAGQSAVGDLLRWWVEDVCEGDEALHAELSDRAAALRPAESGLLAVKASQVLEFLARMEITVRSVAPDAPRPADYLVDKHYLRKHGKDAYYGQG